MMACISLRKCVAYTPPWRAATRASSVTSLAGAAMASS